MEHLKKNPEPYTHKAHCYNCGKEIPEGAHAVVIMSGTIINDGLFMPDKSNMTTIACEVCGEQINEVTGDLNKAFASLG